MKTVQFLLHNTPQPPPVDTIHKVLNLCSKTANEAKEGEILRKLTGNGGSTAHGTVVQNGYGTRIRVELVTHAHKGVSNCVDAALKAEVHLVTVASVCKLIRVQFFCLHDWKLPPHHCIDLTHPPMNYSCQ